MTKQRLDDLAVFGGTPAFAAHERLTVGVPNIGDRDRLFQRLTMALDKRWLSNNGALVQDFEERVADTSAVRHCVAMCNATVALQVGIKALGMTGEVIVPSFTFSATAHAVGWLGLTPVFCDVDPVTHLLDPAHAESLITPRTSGIIGVHVWGQPCSDELTEVARRNGLKLLFDGAHSFGCLEEGRSFAGRGDATVFSFHATKVVNAFEGGALVTDDAALARRVRAIQNFGLVAEDTVNWVGTNAKMSEASAAMGLTSLDAMPEIFAHNRDIYRAYRAGLAHVPGIRMLDYDPSANNCQYVVIEVDEDAAGFGPDLLRTVLRAEGVTCRRYFSPACHAMTPYNTGASLPQTDAVTRRVLQLPTGMVVTRADVARVCGLIQLAAALGNDITERYEATTATALI
ncbi:DegT/DnrJ/EryC1/StrS family aminotransferase [Actinomadura barringtoniae]|uniref:DegT/DnrJ/EryC1/StrS family aminotransferase n=1 Tax=Actinomadura barringtoniae TaxID=1427535 RepID=A0A939PBT6_9ACTN|nr:DegT/DnrJ/EryC1/StrS family aminotransferase [Actinomadura barringtoniae]MBO2445591.1 DegT/DnrJ/EryC1/StrS family aminotransferase [Actinomadura barringtoniae]